MIGNPPYGGFLSTPETEYVLGTFKLQSYQLDSYLLFIEKALLLSRNQGKVGMIIPNTWLLNLTLAPIRKFIFRQIEIDVIVHYSKPVFSEVTVDTEVAILEKSTPRKDHTVLVKIVAKSGIQKVYEIPQSLWKNLDGDPVNIFKRPEVLKLESKLVKCQSLDGDWKVTQGTKPFQKGKGKPPQTKEILDKKPFVSNEKIDETFRPLLRGKMMNKYRTIWDADYWISLGDWLAEPRYSASYDAPEKIIIRQTGDSLVSTLDREQFVVRDNLYTILPVRKGLNLCYLLGLINSQFLNWFYQNVLNPEKGEALAQVKRGHIVKLPIRTIDFSNPEDVANHDRMVTLVERMLRLQGELQRAQSVWDRERITNSITATDYEIDHLVYELYGLSEEEIELVEAAE